MPWLMSRLSAEDFLGSDGARINFGTCARAREALVGPVIGAKYGSGETVCADSREIIHCERSLAS